MPLPPPSFTKSRWLPFFAEVTAKITHHHPSVVVEGCELLRRLLATRVGIGAFLEEGFLLQHVADALIATVACPDAGPGDTPSGGDPEAAVCLLQTVSLAVSLTVAFFNERDEYYSLLAAARAVPLLEALGRVVTAAPRFPCRGQAASAALALLSTLPWAGLPHRARLSVPHGSNVARHVRQLEETVATAPRVLSALAGELTAAAARLGGGGVVRWCAAALRRASIAALQGEVVDTKAAEPGLGHESIDMEDSALARPHQGDVVAALTATFARFANARGHGDCYAAVDDLWCLLVADAAAVCASATAAELAVFDRFLRCEPRSLEDTVLFRSLLAWLCAATQSTEVHGPALVAYASDATAEFTAWLKPPPAPQSTRPGLSAVAGMERPSVSLSILTYVQGIHGALAVEDATVLRWARSLLGTLVDFAAGCAHVTSVLIDAPSSLDSALPDELYLACALQSCRTEAVVAGCVALKLFADILARHTALLVTDAAAETTAAAQAIVPFALAAAVNNPTMQLLPGQSSVLHYCPLCPRTSRPCGLGECAVLALDAALAFGEATHTPLASFPTLARALPALHRVTGPSMHPHLRAAAYRVLVRSCRSFGDVLTVNAELPAITPAAARLVLGTAPAPAAPWETAAAALWLAAVVRATAAERKPEAAALVPAPLVAGLLPALAAAAAPTYAAGALLQLLAAVAASAPEDEDPATAATAALWAAAAATEQPLPRLAALAPLGMKSMATWVQLLQTYSAAVETLRQSLEDEATVRTVADDAVYRAFAATESAATVHWYGAALFHVLALLLRRLGGGVAALADGLPQEVLCRACTDALTAPSPVETMAALSRRYGVLLPEHEPLVRARSDTVAWAAECLRLFFDGARPCAFAGLPAALCTAAAEAMRSGELPERARVAVASAVNTVASLSGHEELQASLRPHAADLFAASTAVPSALPVLALRIRLVHAFKEANHEAATWTPQVVASLKATVASLVVSGQLERAEHETLAQQLSYCASAVGHPRAFPLSTTDAAAFAACIAALLKHGTTRITALRTATALARSDEGRNVLLVETARNVDGRATAEHRNCFSRLVQLTFFSRLSPQEAALGTQAVSTACVGGGSAFAVPLVRLKVLESIEQTLLHCHRTRAPAPLSLVRLLASLSSCPELQPVLAKTAELFAMLLELAALVTPTGTLALLAVRNLTFHAALKGQLCQDSRVVGLFKAALWPSATAAKAALPGKENRSPRGAVALTVSTVTVGRSSAVSKATTDVHPFFAAPLEPASFAVGIERYRRQELGASAFVSLVHSNQRAKGHVRSHLAAPPRVTLREAQDQLATVGPLSQLPEYVPRMEQALAQLVEEGL